MSLTAIFCWFMLLKNFVTVSIRKNAFCLFVSDRLLEEGYREDWLAATAITILDSIGLSWRLEF
jgi:hypothetical protein